MGIHELKINYIVSACVCVFLMIKGKCHPVQQHKEFVDLMVLNYNDSE